MAELGFHFSAPWWLLALLLVLPVGIWLRRSSVHGSDARLNRYADAHLLPHLTGSRELQPRERWRRFLRWTLIWTLLVLAMAGPRWDATQIQLFAPGANLVILLDISRSMEVADTPPSRLTRARQEIEDLLNMNRELRIGLIAFASVAHVIAPITEDNQAIRNVLPMISSDLVRMQGSRLGEALERARTLLAGQPAESQHSLLVISDGDFVDQGLEEQVSALAAEGVSLHVLGVGTQGGGPVPGQMGRFLTDSRGKTVESRLDSAQLQRLAEIGGGSYAVADFRDRDTREILRQAVSGKGLPTATEARTKVWNERFFWLLIPVLLMLLPMFRRVGYRTGEEKP